MSKFTDYIKERIIEPSTIKTIVTFLVGTAGVVASPEHIEIIGAAVIIVLSWVGVTTKESK